MLSLKALLSAGRENAPLRVLVVEDDRQVRHVIEDAVEEAGYEVEAAKDLEAGLLLLQSRPFDIVIADGRLPDGTGMEIADAALEKGIPTLIVTAYAFDLLREKWDLASYNIIQKPVLPSQLVTAVTGLLRLRQRS